MNEGTEWLQGGIATPDEETRCRAEMRQAVLTKPPGALGRLEEVAIQLAMLQGADHPSVDKVFIIVFAGDHGVADENISAFPQSVTAEMVKNFRRGGAAICVAAKALGADFDIINLGTVHETGHDEVVKNYALGQGTENFTRTAAMTEWQLSRALDIGRDAAEHAKSKGAQLFIGGEMGIGNTTVASALACMLLSASPEQLVGPGTGLDSRGVAHKTEVIRQALACHKNHNGTVIEILRRLGGFEIAALVGSYIACAQIGLPVLIDGFICSVAALAAEQLSPGTGKWLLYSHTSAEPGHRVVLDALEARPLVDLGMRLGEGSGAAVTVPVLRMACTLHNDMATFTEAGVSEKHTE